jgi:hypothetical protein
MFRGYSSLDDHRKAENRETAKPFCSSLALATVRARWIGREKEKLQFPGASRCSVVTRPFMTTETAENRENSKAFLFFTRAGHRARGDG